MLAKDRKLDSGVQFFIEKGRREAMLSSSSRGTFQWADEANWFENCERPSLGADRSVHVLPLSRNASRTAGRPNTGQTQLQNVVRLLRPVTSNCQLLTAGGSKLDGARD